MVEKHDASEPRWSATVNRDSDGEPIGIMAFFTADELRQLGIDVDEADAVGFVLEDGEPGFVRHE